MSIYRALKEDSVRGGCLLTAAELDSSKEYLQQADGSWIVAYQVRLNTFFLLAIFLIYELIRREDLHLNVSCCL
jgi:hypothetical protein